MSSVQFKRKADVAFGSQTRGCSHEAKELAKTRPDNEKNPNRYYVRCQVCHKFLKWDSEDSNQEPPPPLPKPVEEKTCPHRAIEIRMTKPTNLKNPNREFLHCVECDKWVAWVDQDEDLEPEPKQPKDCPHLRAEVTTTKSDNERNPNREYSRCVDCGKWLGWVPPAESQPQPPPKKLEDESDRVKMAMAELDAVLKYESKMSETMVKLVEKAAEALTPAVDKLHADLARIADEFREVSRGLVDIAARLECVENSIDSK